LPLLIKTDYATLQTKGTADGIFQFHGLLGAVHGCFGQQPRKAAHVFPHGHHFDFRVGMGGGGKFKPYLCIRIII
jgi:hypothetical protein